MTNPNHIDFFTAQETDIETDWVPINIGDVAIFAGGNFDGADVILQFTPDNPNEVESPEIFTDVSASFDAASWSNASLPEGWMRGVVDNAGESTSVSLRIRPRPSRIMHV